MIRSRRSHPPGANSAFDLEHTSSAGDPPPALGAAVSPLVVAGEIYCISEPAAGLRRGWRFTAGNALVVRI